MPTAETTPGIQTHRAAQAWFDRGGYWLVALFSLSPLIWRHDQFAALFYFGDEWDQLDLIATHGFWQWTWSFFGEHFAPLFKLLWGALVFAGGGSYYFVLLAVWATHAACVATLGRWMRLAGFGIPATVAVMFGFGLPASNVETLGWTIQLITVQGMLFFLLAGAWYQARENTASWNVRALIILCTLVMLSTFSFVRGVLVGTAFALTAIFSLLAQPAARRAWRIRRSIIFVCGAPAIVAAVLVVCYGPGNHQNFSAHGLREPLQFSVYYFLLNPFHRFVEVGTFGPRTALVLGLIKVAILFQGWRHATISQRHLLLPLLWFEIGNAFLLGIGRHNFGLSTATSSRYQYFALISTWPFAGVCLEHIWAHARTRVRYATGVAISLGCIGYFALRDWPNTMANWAEWRGDKTRHTLFIDPSPPAEKAIPGIDFMSTARAKELAARFNLH